MKARSWAVLTALGYGWLFAAWLLAGIAPAGDPPTKPEPAKDRPKKKESAKELFGLTKLHEFHLEIAAADWDKMQPTGGMRFPGGPGGPGGFGGPPAPPRGDDNNADVHRNSGFGLTFPWVHADFSAGGQTYKDVG